MSGLNRFYRGKFLFSLVLIGLLGVLCIAVEPHDRAAWMKQARWGVMTHYLAGWKAREADVQMTVAKWNEMIDLFDVEGLARQLASVRAGYYLITIGQNSGYYLSPNAAYDRYVGIQPSKWDATYTLLAREAFLVSSSMKNGQIEFVKIHPRIDGECRLRNPWGEKVEVALYRNGTAWKNIEGSLLRFDTQKGEQVVVVQEGTSPERFKRTILPESG